MDSLSYFIGKNYKTIKKLKINHFEYKNRNLLKYLLFGYTLNDFLEEYYHLNCLLSNKGLKPNYKLINDFIKNLHNYKMQIIITKREKYRNTYEENHNFKKLDIIFFKSNRLEQNIMFQLYYSNEYVDKRIEYGKKMRYDKKYILNWTDYFVPSLKSEINIEEVIYNNLLKNEIKKIFKDKKIRSTPFSFKNKYKPYIQEHYKIKDKTETFLYFHKLCEDTLNKMIKTTLSCDWYGEVGMGKNPIKLSIPIKNCEIRYINGTQEKIDENKIYIPVKSTSNYKYDKKFFFNELLLNID